MPFWSRLTRPRFASDYEDERCEVAARQDFDALLVELWGPVEPKLKVERRRLGPPKKRPLPQFKSTWRERLTD